MATVILPILWIAFDVAICLRTGFMTKPMPWSEITIWGIVGLILGVVALVAGWNEREWAHEQEVKYERDRASLRAQLEHYSGYNQGAFDRMSRKLDVIVTATIPQVEEDVKTVKSELKTELAERRAREWPRLTHEQKERLTSLLQRRSERELGERRIAITRNNLPDIVNIVEDLVDVFRVAGWEITGEPDRASETISSGMHVRAPWGHASADILASALADIFGNDSVQRELEGKPWPQFFDRTFIIQLAVGR